MPEQILLSWSGGKDSSLALEALIADERYEVVALLTSVTRGYERISIHGVRRVLLDAQAHALGLPLVEVALEPMSSNDAYDAAFLDAVALLRSCNPELRRIAFGDLYLDEVRAYRERLLARGGMEGLFPLWGLDTTALARSFVQRGYVAHLVCVDTTQLDFSFAGRRYDNALLDALPSSVDPCGENGEFHTFVSHGPIFRERLAVSPGETLLRDGRFAYHDLLPDG